MNTAASYLDKHDNIALVQALSQAQLEHTRLMGLLAREGVSGPEASGNVADLRAQVDRNLRVCADAARALTTLRAALPD